MNWKNRKFLESERLYFVPLTVLNLTYAESNYEGWFSDPEVTQFNSHGVWPKTPDEFHQYVISLKNDKSRLVLMMVDKITGKHIGNISLQGINWINRSAEFAIIIGEKDYWGQGLAKESMATLFNHAFSGMNLHRIWTGTSELNIGMQKAIEKIGMIKEGTFQEAIFTNGEFYDIYEYAILSDHLVWKEIKNEN